MTKSNFAILGGTGSIGTAICLYLAKKNLPYTGFSRYSGNFINPGITIKATNYSREDLLAIFQSHHVIVYCMGCSSPGSTLMYEHNPHFAEIEIVLLEIPLQLRPRFVYISSGGSVYGNVLEHKPITELTKAHPLSSYGQAKLKAEIKLKYLYLNNPDNLIILRVGNAYNYQSLKKSQGLPDVAMRLLMNESSKINIFGDGSTVRDYINTEDIAICVVMAGISRISGIYNLACGRGISINDMLSLIELITAKSFDRIHIEPRSVDPPYNVLSIKKLSSHLLWFPSITLEEGLDKLYRRLCKSTLQV